MDNIEIDLNLEQKPYNQCLVCEHLRIDCNGPRTSSMPLPRWCEYMRALRDRFHLTNEKIAEHSGVSLRTINRIMSTNPENHDQDLMRENARLIEQAILGNNTNAPCWMVTSVVNAQHSEQELAAAREEMSKLQDAHAAELAAVRADCEHRIADMRIRIDRLRKNEDFYQREHDRKADVINQQAEVISRLLGLLNSPK